MDEYLGTRKVNISQNVLDSINFGKMSPISQRIVKNSSLFYKASLLSSSKAKRHRAAYHLTKSFFNVKD
jgi:hypothetical protein